MRLYAFELHLLQTRIERCRHTRLQSLGYIRSWSYAGPPLIEFATTVQSLGYWKEWPQSGGQFELL